MTRHYKELVGVLVREDLESNILYIEHVFEFATPDVERGVYIQTNFGFSCYRSFNALVERQEELWNPVLGDLYRDTRLGARSVYLSFRGTKHPHALGIEGKWSRYAEVGNA
jgi:hypothetical protein